MESTSLSWYELAGKLASVIVVITLFGWLLWRALRQSPEPARLLSRWIITVVAVIGFLPIFSVSKGHGHPVVFAFSIICGLLCGLVLALVWTPVIVDMVGNWFGRLYTGGMVEPEPEPVYSSALSKRLNGQPREALQLIQAELAKFPGDYAGKMLMAEIHAKDLADLQAAESWVMTILREPQHPPAARAFALFSLADWYLSVGKSPEEARRIFEMVEQVLPASEYALQAAQRLAHLQTPEMLLQREAPRTIKVPEGRRDLGLRPIKPEEIIKYKSPEEEAEELVRQLEQHPLDLEARERLAQVYATELGRVDLAVEQLEQLVNCPQVPPKQVAHWLQMMADFHLRLNHDTAAAEAALRRIIDLYPGTALAAQAGENIMRLPTQPAHHEPANIRLGQYEQYLGLKKRKPQ